MESLGHFGVGRISAGSRLFKLATRFFLLGIRRGCQEVRSDAARSISRRDLVTFNYVRSA